MAVMYTRPVFLRFLLVFVALDATGGVLSFAKGHFRRKDFPADERIGNQEHVNNSSKISQQHSEINRFREQASTGSRDTFMKVTSQTRTTVILHCDTRKLKPPGTENLTVIWIKIRPDNSFTILTEGKKILSYDKRFVASNKTDSLDWSLYIRYTKWEDAGLYKCQICANSDFSNSIYVELKLREAWAEIIGNPVREVDKVGSPLRLSCELKNSIEAPRYIYWYHGDRVINYDLNDGATVREGSQGSELIFPRAQEVHAGNYSCVPSNARPASVLVIINAKTSAMAGPKNSCQDKSPPYSLITSVFVLTSLLCLVDDQFNTEM